MCGMFCLFQFGNLMFLLPSRPGHRQTSSLEFAARALFGVATAAGIFFAVTRAEAQNQFQGGYPASTGQYRPIQNPTSVWAVTPPAVPDQTPQGEIVDHTSMSPDSWSAPIPVPPNFGYPNSRPSTTPQTSNSGSSRENAFDPNALQPDATNTPSLIQSENKSNGRALPQAPKIPQLVGPKLGPASSPSSPFRPSKTTLNPSDSSNEFILPSSPLSGSGTGNVESDSLRYPLGQSSGETGDRQGESYLPLETTFSGLSSMPEQTIESSVPQTTPASPSVIAGGVSNFPSQGFPLGVNDVVAESASQNPTPGFFRRPQAPVGANSMFGVVPNYRPDLGHRNYAVTVRNPGSWDNGEKFDFEDKKKEYPPMSEILATGRYFGSLSLLYLRPAFQNNTAITTSTANFSQSTAFDFDYEAAPQFRFGFESKFGPGFELNYMQYDESSNLSSFTSNGTVSGETSTWMMGPSRWTRLTAANAGDTLQSSHSIDVESFNLMVFKELKFPISRLNGSFGMQYVSIAQTLEATVTNGSTLIGSLNANSDMRAYGPRFVFEYYRPVGHTPLEFVTSFGGSVLFGKRDQFVQNSITGDFNRTGADEFVTTSEFFTGAQYKKNFAENRSVFARVGFHYQAWHGGGTAIDAQDDFGLRGFSIGVGYNR